MPVLLWNFKLELSNTVSTDIYLREVYGLYINGNEIEIERGKQQNCRLGVKFHKIHKLGPT